MIFWVGVEKLFSVVKKKMETNGVLLSVTNLKPHVRCPQVNPSTIILSSYAIMTFCFSKVNVFLGSILKGGTPLYLVLIILLFLFFLRLLFNSNVFNNHIFDGDFQIHNPGPSLLF